MLAMDSLHVALVSMEEALRILIQPRATMETLRAAIDRWDADMAEYLSRGNKDLDDAQKVSMLFSIVPKNLNDHLELNIGRLDTYMPRQGPRW
ncbi:unnamed protein product [Symbiodinium sp. KB8]|nr:unnamed protein product [Symbiodinium sp. KB8]